MLVTFGEAIDLFAGKIMWRFGVAVRELELPRIPEAMGMGHASIVLP